MMSRRQMIAGAVAGLGGIGLVGNAVYQEHRPKLSLSVMNFHDQPHSVTVQLVRRGADEWSEGLAWMEYIDIEAQPEDGDVPRLNFPAVAPARPYIVRIEALSHNIGDREFTYLPDCSGYDSPTPSMYIVISTDAEIKLKGTGCSDDSLWY
ncbi:hypothetical protein [Haloferax volcanii]|nr:hypothetical protein [Haloferax volcanii]